MHKRQRRSRLSLWLIGCFLRMILRSEVLTNAINADHDRIRGRG